MVMDIGLVLVTGIDPKELGEAARENCFRCGSRRACRCFCKESPLFLVKSILDDRREGLRTRQLSVGDNSKLKTGCRFRTVVVRPAWGARASGSPAEVHLTVSETEVLAAMPQYVPAHLRTSRNGLEIAIQMYQIVD